MKFYSVRINRKRIKLIPRKVVLGWILLLVIFLYCIIQPFSVYQSLDNLQHCKIDVESVYLWDSHDTKGRRMKLVILSEDTTYYLWYPQGEYRNFADAIENDLLTGNITSVEAKIVNRQTFRERLLNQKRVVELKSNYSVYYDLNTEKDCVKQEYISSWLLLIIVFVFLLFYSFFICLIYGVMTFQKVKQQSK